LILLDTHVLVWLVAQPERLSKPAASAIRRARASDGLSIADVTVWEVASLCARGTLQIHRTVENTVQDLLIHSAVQVKPITPEIAALATQFPNDYPHDLVDRLIGATARAEGLALVTRDESIRRCPLLKTIW
jgi:PIN domain nuclease of toxin-antitoxin system